MPLYERSGFKKGDRVRVVAGHVCAGRLGTVKSFPVATLKDKGWIGVEFDDTGKLVKWHHSYFERAVSADRNQSNDTP